MSDEEEGSLWSRTVEVGQCKLSVEEHWGVGIGGTLWEGGILLAQYLSSAAFPASSLRGKRTLELGAGVSGLPSLVAASLGSFSEVWVTDIDECMEGLTQNITDNLPTGVRLCTQPPARQQDPAGTAAALDQHAYTGIPATGGRSSADSNGASDKPRTQASAPVNEPVPTLSPRREPHNSSATQLIVHELDWQAYCRDWESHNRQLKPPLDLLLVADVVYAEELVPSLLECMWHLTTSHSMILLAYYQRGAAAHQKFWQFLPHFFAYSKILEESYGANPHPRDVGLFTLTRKSITQTLPTPTTTVA